MSAFLVFRLVLCLFKNSLLYQLLFVLCRFFHSHSSSPAVENVSLSPPAQNDSSQAASSECSKQAASQGDSKPTMEADDPLLVCEESCSPPPSPPARPASQGLGVFSWSGGSSSTSSSSSSLCRPSSPALTGLATLQQFQRKKETRSWSGTVQGQRVQQQSSHVSDEDEEEERADSSERDRTPGSPPSQDSAYFSQPNSTFGSLEETPTSSFTCLLDASTPSEVTDSLQGYSRHYGF